MIVGYGGHAKSVADCIERQSEFNIIGYTDLEEHVSKYRYLGTDDMLQSVFDSGVRNAVVGIGYLGHGDVRVKLYNKLKDIGFAFPIIKDPSSIVSESAIVAEGTFIGKSAIINSEAKIGKMTIINTKALVEHECEIGDYSHVAVGAVLCGQVKVGESVFIGANATVVQCKEVNSNTIVPAGEVVR